MIKVKQSGGFTLVELLVSVAILLLVLGSAVSVEVQSIKLADTNQHSLQAANLAQEQLNLVKTVRDNNNPTSPFANFPADGAVSNLVQSGSQWQFATGSTTKTVESGGINYTVEIKVTSLTADNLP